MTLQEILNTDHTVPQKKILTEKFGLQVKSITHYLGYSYTHTLNILNGLSRLTPQAESKLNKLIAELEAEGGRI